MQKLAVQLYVNQHIEQAIRSAAKAGFTAVSLCMDYDDTLRREDWEQRILWIRNLLEEHGVACVQTHLPCYDLKLSSEVLDPAMEQAQDRCILAAGILGAQWNAYHCRTAITRNWSPRVSMDENMPQLERLLRLAKENNTGIAVENLSLFPDVYWMRFLGSDVEDLVELCRRFDDPAMQICWDFGHAHLLKHDMVGLIRTAGERIKCTHIHNNYQLQDDHFLPSVGTIDWPAAMGALREVGYSGYLTLEPKMPIPAVWDTFMAHGYDCCRYLDSLLAAPEGGQ